MIYHSQHSDLKVPDRIGLCEFLQNQLIKYPRRIAMVTILFVKLTQRFLYLHLQNRNKILCFAISKLICPIIQIL